MVKDSSKYFYVCDGSVLSGLGDLKKAIKTMPEDVYNYHAQRDDWSKWVLGVVKNKDLASKLSGADMKKAKTLLGVSAAKPAAPKAKPAAKKPTAKKPVQKAAKPKAKTPVKKIVKTPAKATKKKK